MFTIWITEENHDIGFILIWKGGGNPILRRKLQQNHITSSSIIYFSILPFFCQIKSNLSLLQKVAKNCEKNIYLLLLIIETD